MEEYMKYKDILERVSWGEEFFFFYHNEKYWISENESGFYLTRVRDSYTQPFSTAQDLFENGIVEEKTLVDVWNAIEEYF